MVRLWYLLGAMVLCGGLHAQITITPNPLQRLGVPENGNAIITNGSQFTVNLPGCTLPNYTFTLLESVKIDGTIADPSVNPGPTILFRGAGYYKFRVCATCPPSTVESCVEWEVNLIPVANVLPVITVTPAGPFVLPIGAAELQASISDPGDLVNYEWHQDPTNPVTITMPSGTVQRSEATKQVPLPLTGINKVGFYRFQLRATDSRGGNSESPWVTVIVRPPTSNIVVNLDDLQTLEAPVVNIPVNAQISGVNTFNDKVKYTWTKVSGPSDIALPTPNPTYIPLGESTASSTLTLNNLATGTYSLEFKVEDEYYPGTEVIETLTFQVNPPRADLQVVEVVLAPPLVSPILVRDSKNPINSIQLNGRILGIKGSDQVEYQWEASESNPTSINSPSLSAQRIPIGQTEFTVPALEINNPNALAKGEYTFKLVARDVFYNTEAFSEVVVIITEPVTIQPASFFSPNGDGQNDTWTVNNIEGFPEVGVVILNEQGQVIYKAESYSETGGWDGKYNGKLAPEGAYYYVFKNRLDGTQTTGSFVIIR